MASTMVSEKGQNDVVELRIPRVAAVALQHWLLTVPDAFVPVTHPAERQALADLLTALEMQGPPQPNPSSCTRANVFWKRPGSGWEPVSGT